MSRKTNLFATSPLATALCAAMPALGAAPSSDSLVLYGRLNTGLEQVRVHGQDGSTRLSNYRSVLGLRGEEGLGGGLKAVWQLEGSLAMDTGAGSSFTNRDTRLGLSGSWGTAFAGVWTLPYTTATSAFDPFYPTTAGYMALMGNGSASISDNVQDTHSFDRRQVNQIQYWSPMLAGLNVRFAYAVNEETVASTGARPWLASGSIAYEHDGLTLTAAIEHHDAYQAMGTADTGTKLGASYTWGAARVSAIVERLAYGTASGDLTRQGWYLSGTYRLGAGMLKAGYSHAADGRGSSIERVGALRSGARTGASQFTVGYDHELSRRTSLQAFYSQIDNQQRASYDFAINSVGATTGRRIGVMALGMRHQF